MMLIVYQPFSAKMIFMAFSSKTVEIWVRKGKTVWKLLMKSNEFSKHDK